MSNQQYMLLGRIDSYIEPLLKRVLEANELEISGEQSSRRLSRAIQIETISSSCDKAEADHFKLSIPYAKQTLTWNVFFDSQCPEMGPDFLFNDDTFLMDMNIDTLSARLPSLAKWNVNDQNALLNVLMELLLCYKQHQVQLLQKQDRLKGEYDMLMSSPSIAQEDVEVMLLPFGSKPMEATFLLSLSIDVSQLIDRPFQSQNDIAMLLVTFYGPNWNRIMRQIHFSKYLEQVLDGTSTLELPHYPIDKPLTHYVLETKKYIEEKVKSLVQILESRRLFIAAMLNYQRFSLIEYDACSFQSISLLLSDQDFHFMIDTKLPPSFPPHKPIVTIVSIYHMNNTRDPYSEIFEFPYSAKWRPDRMVKEIFKQLMTYINKFKTNSVGFCS
ncbi:NAD(P)HX epimerase isoform X1 [Augochlora pura]